MAHDRGQRGVLEPGSAGERLDRLGALAGGRRQEPRGEVSSRLIQSPPDPHHIRQAGGGLTPGDSQQAPAASLPRLVQTARL